MARNYYYLVSGLREYNVDTDAKGFDALALRDEILLGIDPRDATAVRELYQFYDVLNILARWNHKSVFNTLANMSAEELEDNFDSDPIIAAYRNKIKEDKYAEIDESIDTSIAIEKSIWERFYDQRAKSSDSFIRDWFAFDQQIRNICTAYILRAKGDDVAPALIGDTEINNLLARSSATDFSLKGEVEYIDRLIPILENTNMLDKERKLDLLRWEMADSMTDNDYFNMRKILSYCVKLNIIHRWLTLDRNTGEVMFRRLIEQLSDKSIIEKIKE